MTTQRVELIRERLAAALSPSALEIVDESDLHAGHEGARDGGGHFRVRIVADRFTGLRAVQRHRLVYQALGDLMQTEVHALAITALTAGEAAAG